MAKFKTVKFERTEKNIHNVIFQDLYDYENGETESKRKKFLSEHNIEIETINYKNVLMSFVIENGECIYIRRDFLSEDKSDVIEGENAIKGYKQAIVAGLI